MKITINRAKRTILEGVKSLIHARRLLVFIGDLGTYLAAYEGTELVGSYFIKGEIYNISDHKNFLEKYKKFTVLIIIDKAVADLHHSQIIVAQSLLPLDHVGRFIKKTFDKRSIVASNVHDITNDKAGETWHTALMSIQETPELDTIVSSLASNCVKFKGIYFFALNTPNLIQNICSSNKYPVNSNLRLFVTLTSFSGIRVLVCDNQNVMESHLVPFPYDKSLEYAQGVIEQSVSDCIISLKNYIHHHQERPSLIIVAPKEMQPLLKQSKFDVGEVIIIQTESNDSFADRSLSYFLNKNIEHKSTNEQIKSFDRASKLSDLYFKPIWIIMAVIIYFLFNNELEKRKNYRKTSKVNEKYYIISEEYRKQREQYPYIDKFGAIVDFHNAMISLSLSQELPFDILDKFLHVIPANLRLHSIDWDKVNNKVIKVDAKYVSQTSDTSALLSSLDSDLQSIQRSLSDHNVKIIKDTNSIINHGGFVSMAVQLIITYKWK